MKFITQMRQALSNTTNRLRMFRHFRRHYDLRTAINLSRSRVKEMRAIK